MGIDIGSINMHTIKAMLNPDCIKLTCDLLQELFELRKTLMYDIVGNEDYDLSEPKEPNGPNEEAHVGEAPANTQIVS